MSRLLKEIITKKIKQLAPGEILHYGKQYGFHVTNQQAEAIATYLKNHSVNPFDEKDRMKMLQELARITDLDTAKKAQKLFVEIVRSYGLEHLFH